jgi:hypothetical protein
MESRAPRPAATLLDSLGVPQLHRMTHHAVEVIVDVGGYNGR